MTEPRDMDLNLEFSREAFKGCKYGSKSDSLYIQRGDKEALPSKASTYIRVADWFKDSDKLYLYSFDKENGARAIEDELSVENGYVTCSTMYGEADKYILSTEKWDVAKGNCKRRKRQSYGSVDRHRSSSADSGAGSSIHREEQKENTGRTFGRNRRGRRVT